MSSRPRTVARAFAGAALAAAGGCGTVIGDPCGLEGGVGQSGVVYEQGDPDCGGDLCMSIDGTDPYCTSTCGSDTDCPAGFSCQEVELSPNAGFNTALLCVDDTPTGGEEGDDDTVPPGCSEGVWGTAPEISNLVVTAQPEGASCVLHLDLDWYDVDGDLNGADSLIRFDDLQSEGVFEVEDTEQIHLTLLVAMDGFLEFGAPYDIEVSIRDRGCNWSNVLEEPGYVMPDATCQ